MVRPVVWEAEPVTTPPTRYNTGYQLLPECPIGSRVTPAGVSGIVSCPFVAGPRKVERNHLISSVSGVSEDMCFPRRLNRRLMAANPQDAAKLIQAIQAIGTTANAQASSGDLANKTKLESDLESLIAKYRAAHKTSSGPFEAKVKALNPAGVGEGGVATPPELIRQGNADYEKLCGEWWSASGPFHAWLKRYRDYLIQVEIPLKEKFVEGTASQLTAFGITAPYRSTATMEAVLEYMTAARRIFVERSGNPITDKM